MSIAVSEDDGFADSFDEQGHIAEEPQPTPPSGKQGRRLSLLFDVTSDGKKWIVVSLKRLGEGKWSECCDLVTNRLAGRAEVRLVFIQRQLICELMGSTRQDQRKQTMKEVRSDLIDELNRYRAKIRGRSLWKGPKTHRSKYNSNGRRAIPHPKIFGN